MMDGERWSAANADWPSPAINDTMSILHRDGTCNRTWGKKAIGIFESGDSGD